MHARRFALVGIAVVLAACSEPTSQPSEADDAAPAASLSQGRAGDDRVVPGDVLVGLKEESELPALARAYSLTVGDRGPASSFTIVRTRPGNEYAMAATLRADRRVAFAEPNYLRQLHTINPYLWAFRNPGGLNMRFSDTNEPIPASYASIVDADEDNVENYAAGGSDVVIGSIDTGVDFGHPQFTGRLIAGRDWVSNDNDPSDTDGHGTHTTGMMAGSTVGVAGVSGAASHVKVYVQRVCGPSGCATSWIVSAIYAAADQPGLVAMNLSLGGGRESTAEKNAIAYAKSKGVLVIASAGNSGSGKVACPACDPNAISVSATNWRDELTYYSQYGKGLDISAPGGQCYSNTTPEGCIYSSVPGGYDWYQGTSMAAPQVTGTAAIVASRTVLRGAALRTRLEATADDKGATGYDTKFGNGRLNSYRAVTDSTLSSPQ